jgi:hypothetical protein
VTDTNIKCPLIDAATYALSRAKLNEFERWREGRESYRPEDVPEFMRDVGNKMRADVYMFEEFRDKPEKTTYYIRDIAGQWYITNWTGDYVLARAEITKRWRDGRGNRRYSIRTTIPNLGTYTGQTAGAGMYINLRRIAA